MAKLLPNINKSVPQPTDPALIQQVSDAIEAVDQAIGAKPSTLETTAKTIVPAINELKGKIDTVETNSSLLVEGVCGTKSATTVAGQSWFQDNLAYPTGYNQNNCNVFITPMATPYGYAVFHYGVIKGTSSVQVRFATRDGASIATVEDFPYAYLFVKTS